MKKYIKFLIPLLLFVACREHQEQIPASTYTSNVVETKGYVVPIDSISEPEVIPIDENKLTKTPAGKPTIIPTNTNVHIAGTPEIFNVQLSALRTITSGTDTFPLPKTIKVNFDLLKTIVAGMPAVVIAKDAYIKDQNPQNFSSFSKLQGLKHDVIGCMLQDRGGNLWFGTYGGGVSKYDGKSFANFTEKEGLSNNVIRSIAQDQTGNLWFGTNGGGVTKYDGKSFTNFTENEGLANNIVLSIIQDQSGNMWFGTQGGGVSKLAQSKVEGYDTYTFTNFTEKEGLTNNSVNAILQDQSGNIWFCTDGGGLSKLALCKVEGNDTYTFTNFTENEGLSNNIVLSVLQDRSGNFWFGTYGGGVSKLALSKVEGYDTYAFTNFTENEGLSNNSVLSILQDQSGNYWFGTESGGVSKYDGKSFTNFTEKEGLSNNSVNSMLEDKSGNLWLGTDGGGVSKYDGKLFTNFTEKEGLSSNSVSSIIKDKSGNLWFGIYSRGVSKYDGKSFTNFTEKEGLTNNSVRSILQDKSGNLWFGTYGGGVSKYDGKYFTNFTENEGLSNNTVSSMLQDQSGNIWFGTYGGVSKYDGKSFTNFTEEEGLTSNIVLSILQDQSGNLWFSTDGGGVSKYDGKSFTNFTEKEGLTNNSVLSMLQDQSGNLWFGTPGGGVSKLVPSKVEGHDTYTITNFTEKEGLSNNYVFSILQDKIGNLWFGTRFGLNKLKAENSTLKTTDPKLSLFKNYNYEDGFLGIGVNGGMTICEDNSGTIWIGSNDRLIAYHPEGDQPDTIAPNIQLTSIELFNENIPWESLRTKKVNVKNVALDTSFTLGNGVTVGDFEFDDVRKWYDLPENLCLAYNNNYLTFNFVGITTKSPQKVKYQYQLEGIDKNWSAITNRSEATYGNLPHGKYTFHIKAMNSEGYWSKEFTYSFTIRPPWWKTWWFRTLLGISGLLMIYSYIKWRERKLKKDKLILEKKVKEQTHELSDKNEELKQQNEEIIAQRDEISSQRDEIEAQRDLVMEQKDRIEEIHKDLTDSINYAERIQRSFLATKVVLDDNLNDYFIFYKPKDVVSGDFYWAGMLSNNNFALATADSTGHGVPGAIMSILNITSIEKAVEQSLCEPSEILNHTRKTIIERLKKDGSAEGGKDGMDASLICFDFVNNKFTYSSANNPIWIIRENKLIELNPDKMPVGKHDKDHLPFTQNEFQLQKGDVVYTLTDGLPDQFGGPKGKKFKYAQLKDLLISINSKSMQGQKLLLEETLHNWKGDLEQVDDITILGIRI